MPNYDAYLLRIWRNGRQAGAGWSARLEHLPDGACLRFSDQHALLAYLQDAIEPEHQEAHAVHEGTARSVPIASSEASANL